MQVNSSPLLENARNDKESAKSETKNIGNLAKLKLESKELKGESKSAGKSAGSTIASTIKKVFVAAGIGKALTSTIKEGGKLEQSLGGVETLFKGNADTVKKYAQEAYKTVGVSANGYMENVTSFSASLLQSMGGDTKEAAKVAHTAMVDMGDNANKMGTDMRDIQNAYQGFAKSNYTMLDNLKLGGHNRLAQYKPLENGGTLNVLRRRQYRVNYELKVA